MFGVRMLTYVRAVARTGVPARSDNFRAGSVGRGRGSMYRVAMTTATGRPQPQPQLTRTPASPSARRVRPIDGEIAT